MEKLKIAIDSNNIAGSLEALVDSLIAQVGRIDRLHEVMIQNAINEVLEVPDYVEYFGNVKGKNGFYVDLAFEAVYFAESDKKAKAALLRLKKAFEAQKLVKPGKV